MSVNLDAIQARADAATEGPWFREYSDVVTAHPDPRDVEEGYEDARNSRVVRGAPHLPKKDGQGIADATFIANARTDVPALLAYARDLEARSNLARELHRPITHHFLTPPAGSLEVCEACRWEYPCPTIAALTATEGKPRA